MDNQAKYNRISRIEVNNLFGKIDYALDFDDGNDVSIMIAPNGYGKTTILKLINATLNPTFQSINAVRNITFNSFKCYLSNGATVCLSRQSKFAAETAYHAISSNSSSVGSKRGYVSQKIEDLSANGLGLKLEIFNSATKEKPYVCPISAYIAQNTPSSFFSRRYESDDDIDILWRTERNQEMIRDSLTQLSHILEDSLQEYDCVVPVNFITANRLRAIKEPLPRTRGFRDVDPLDDASEYLHSIVSVHLEEYGKKKAEASNSLPKLYVDKGKLQAAGYDTFKNRWSDYCEWLKTFHNLGFLDSEESDIGDTSLEDYDAFGAFFDVYLESFEKTLEPLLEIYMKFSLFKNIFEERIGSNSISPKTISFTREGVVVLMDDGHPVKITELSSGEKNDFIMFFNLIFKSVPGELVLIDEPEISLHIEWQETYIDKLLKICKENQLQAIITTHSPHIINGHYDLLKDL